MYLLALPDDVLEKILSYVSYDEISRSRLVCQRFNEVSKRVLNHGFHKVEKYHSKCLKLVKSQLPRRESERRNHSLARHCDILTAIETRLSLLSMTFKKYIDLNICCFIPGKEFVHPCIQLSVEEECNNSPPVLDVCIEKTNSSFTTSIFRKLFDASLSPHALTNYAMKHKVLDEIYRVLRYVTSVQSPVRTHEVLQELRDLSSMAMEYFDEKIAPELKRHKETVPRINIVCSTAKHIRPVTPVPQITKIARFVFELNKRHNNLMSEVSGLRIKKKEFDGIGKRVCDLEKLASESKKRLDESDKLISEQQITISQQAVQLFEQELKIEKLNKMLKEKQAVTSPSKIVKNIRTTRQRRKCTYFKKAASPQKVFKRKLITNSEDKKIENEVKKLKI